MTPSLEHLSSSIALPSISSFEYVAIAVYPLIFLPPFDRRSIFFENSNVTIVVGYGELEVPPPFRVGPAGISAAGEISFRVSHGDSPINLENHSWAVCYAPYKIGEAEPWNRIRHCISAISLLEQNRVFQPCLLRFISDQAKGICSQLGPEAGVPIPPMIFKTPEQAFETIVHLLGQNLDIDSVGFALDWFYRSLNSQDTVFKFLAAWIACETITGSSATDVSKIVQKLHGHFQGTDGYSCADLKEAKEYFLLGRLHGVRGRLAHSGKVVGISEDMAIYAQMMFCEMVFAHFSIPSSGVLMPFFTYRRDAVLKNIVASENEQ